MRIILIVFASIHLATGGALVEEIAKLPYLVQHFQFHRSETPNLDFARFLWLHYVETAHQHDGNQHSQLPMHGFHVHGAVSMLSQPPVCQFALKSIPLSHNFYKTAFHYQFFIPRGVCFGIFQPPKTA